MSIPKNFSSIAEIETALFTLPDFQAEYSGQATDRQNQLTKPQGSLGKLEDLAIFLAGWQGVEKPALNNAQALVFAGNHGICSKGVSPFPQEVTAIMVENFKNKGAAINQLCAENNADLKVIALDLDKPTGDISTGSAMSEDDLLRAFNAGYEALDLSADIALMGEMGIGNSTISAALCAGVFGEDGANWVGAGAGSDAAGISLKASLVDQAITINKELLDTPFGILRALGGREQAAICGAVIAARLNSIPVLLDGFIATSAVAPLSKFDGLLDHCLVAHKSVEPGHIKLLDKLGKEAIFDLNMRLGEGSGAAVALGILRSAIVCHNGMATFAEAGISV